MSGCPEPKSKQDIVWIQLDILHVFANAGAPLNLPDREGETPSAKACRKVTYFEAHVKEYETKSFLEGAMLLGKYRIVGCFQGCKLKAYDVCLRSGFCGNSIVRMRG